jgi:2-octaprenylphenol hydroxylase
MTGKQYDLIIVGAGIAGSALACALGGSGLKVAIIEAQAVEARWPPLEVAIDGYDTRVSALTASSQAFLNTLGVWPLIAQRRISPYRHMKVWDAEGTGSISFNAEDINQSELGHIVENRLTVAALLARLGEHSNIDLLTPLRLASMDLSDGQRLLEMEDGTALQAPLVVAADGANSRIRELAGIASNEWDYNHNAIVATVKTEQPHGETARQRFLPQGPLAFLPLTGESGHYCSIVWSAIPEYASNLMALDEQAFAEQLAAAFEHRLGKVEAVSRRFSFPLRQRHAKDYVQQGLALVGDAAHTIHPLAGQGINLGLLDVQVLAEELLRAHERQLPIAELAVLERYQRRRKSNNLAMMAAMEGFKRLFAEPALPLRWARNAGMRWVDKTAPVKQSIMRRAMGF